MATRSSGSSSSLMVCALMMILVAAITAPAASAALSCSTVLATISPCISYVQRGGASVPTSCCDGVRKLNAETSATPDLQAACNCLKTLIPSVGADPALVNGLPARCHINLPYKYSPSLDCSKLTR